MNRLKKITLSVLNCLVSMFLLAMCFVTILDIFPKVGLFWTVILGVLIGITVAVIEFLLGRLIQKMESGDE